MVDTLLSTESLPSQQPPFCGTTPHTQLCEATGATILRGPASLPQLSTLLAPALHSSLQEGGTEEV